MTKSDKKSDASVVIKKYANRRLYDTNKSAYITLEDLCDMVKMDVDFQVVDAKTGEDLTRSVLTQIIFEQESKGYSLLPINFLRQVIKVYDDSLRTVLPSYLETTMSQFTNNKDKMRNYVKDFDALAPFKQFEDIGRQNMKIFEETMSMWSQFNPMAGFSDDEKK
jgi:polyhydroxyalkanoate synthesis repressor PhaR